MEKQDGNVSLSIETIEAIVDVVLKGKDETYTIKALGAIAETILKRELTAGERKKITDHIRGSNGKAGR